MMMDKPKAYVGNSNYIFVSYSSRDSVFVYRVITKLTEQGVRIWYDEDLKAEKEGDNGERLKTWLEQVEDKVKSVKCMGVVFFISENVLEHNKAILAEMKITNQYKRRYCAVNMLEGNSEGVKIEDSIKSFFKHQKKTVKQECSEKRKQEKLCDELKKAKKEFVRQFQNEKICYKYEEQNDENFSGVIKEIEGWCFRRDKKLFPDGNVIHNGHIEYFPSLLEATPFNFTYFLISNVWRNIAVDLEVLLDTCARRKHIWKEYPFRAFLDEEFREIDKNDKTGIVVCMDETDISDMERLLNRRNEYLYYNPIVFNINVENGGEDFKKAAEKIKGALRKVRQSRQSGQNEIDTHFLVQTERICQRQRAEDINEIRNIRDILEKWRILLSDRHYFEEVLVHCGEPGISWLLHQSTSDEKEIQSLSTDSTLLRRWDRERFIKKIYEWEDEEHV